MLAIAIQYKRAIWDITSEETLLDFALTAGEWIALDYLCEVLDVRDTFVDLFHFLKLLQVFKDATTYFSREDASLANVIPIMDKLDAMLATAVIQRKSSDLLLSALIKAALLVAKDTLNKYYDLTDDSNLYRLAISASFH